MSTEHAITQHTPGPWMVSEIISNRAIFKEDSTGNLRMVKEELDLCIEGDGLILLTIDSRPPEAQANARLIAAAPDLLAALESVCTIASCAPHDDADRAEDALNKIFHKARAALAKAQGGAA